MTRISKLIHDIRERIGRRFTVVGDEEGAAPVVTGGEADTSSLYGNGWHVGKGKYATGV